MQLNGKKHDKSLNVKISAKAKGKVTKKQIEQIIDQAIEINQNVGSINIEGQEDSIQTSGLRSQNNGLKLTPFAWYDTDTTVNLSKTYTSSMNAQPVQFIINVAKGSKKNLTTSTTKEISLAIEGSGSTKVLSTLKGTLTGKFSKTYTTATEWAGPPESFGTVQNTAISRNYYFTGYKKYGTWYATECGWPSGDVIGGSGGNFYEPETTYTEWSMDLY